MQTTAMAENEFKLQWKHWLMDALSKTKNGLTGSKLVTSTTLIMGYDVNELSLIHI